LSESEDDEDMTDEGDESEIAKELEKAAAREKLESTRETSGNSNTSTGSGSSSNSTGSNSLAHSFSVEEIQNVRKQLKVNMPSRFCLFQIVFFLFTHSITKRIDKDKNLSIEGSLERRYRLRRILETRGKINRNTRIAFPCSVRKWRGKIATRNLCGGTSFG
jgi:hypothetical protein